MRELIKRIVMNNKLIKGFKGLFSLDIASAFGTWALVAGSSCFYLWSDIRFSQTQLFIAAALYVTFIGLWLISTIEEIKYGSKITKISLLLIQYACIISLYFIVPFVYTAILVTLWCTLLPQIMPMRLAILTSPLWSAPLWLIFQYYWMNEHMGVSAALFLMFNIFALIMVNTAMSERLAKERANQLNRQLMATQLLLSQATKQAERTRIARDIHDLLGHHLTALSINLQVAARITQGEAQQKIETCHSLAKLLLSDVREAVSEIREKSTIDLKEAIQALFANLPGIEFRLDCPQDLNIGEVDTADTILKSIQESLTNSLKHGKAKKFFVNLHESEHNIILDISDNGTPPKHFSLGNGLIGMQERIKLLGGQIRYSSLNTGFSTHITLPVGAI
jgi:two-component system, NarL family, sensor histidine kinase DesK